MSRHTDRMGEQLKGAAALTAELFVPGIGEKLSRMFGGAGESAAAKPHEETPRESDVVTPAEGACSTCEGAGVLTSVSGRKVICGACEGKGK
jgi:hypothetical protein